jgi:hypothetical protein
MEKTHVPNEEKKSRAHKAKPAAEDADHGKAKSAETGSLAGLQHQVGNRAVQRMLAQRSGEGSFDLDDETAARINSQRGGGQTLDSATSERMGAATGEDFSNVRVHTSSEADELNQQLSAKAFTTGQDIFFKEGAYDPGSSGGQELLAHELTHVVQQRNGAVPGGGGKMKVNAPGDSFEQEADSVAHGVASGTGAAVQRQEEDKDEEEQVQRQEEDEKEEVQMQAEDEEDEIKAGQ